MSGNPPSLKRLNQYFDEHSGIILQTLDAIISDVGPNGYNCRKFASAFSDRDVEVRPDVDKVMTLEFQKLWGVFQERTRDLDPLAREFLAAQWEKDKWDSLVTTKTPEIKIRTPWSAFTLTRVLEK